MTLILDYAWAKPTPAAIKAAGYSGVMRYLSTDATKNLSKTEATGLLAAGLSIGLVWETTAQRAGAGFAAGAADAATAEAQADALGYPSTAVLFYAVDYDAAPSAVAPYFAGVVSKAHRPVGVYGSARVVEGVNVPYKWQATAWSGGRVSTVAHLYQRLHATVAHPIASTDENVVLHDFPMWTNAPAVPARTAPVAPSRATTRTPLPVRATVGKLAVDGMFGPATIRRLQQWAKVTADGKLGPLSWAVIQHRVGSSPDGRPGPATWKAIQRLVGATQDGVPGPATYRALQTYLNTH